MSDLGTDPTRIDISVDPLERRMSGVAAHGNTPFDVPFISQIDATLYVGGCRAGLVLPKEIDHIVSLYPWEQYKASRNLKSQLYVTMYDSTDQAFGQVRSIAAWVNNCRADGPTLVHCQAGLNRSNLIAATALILEGMHPEAAVALLRKKRSPAVLCNGAFEQWLTDEAVAA